MSTEAKTASDLYEQGVKRAQDESLLEMIQKRELMINCSRGGLVVWEPGGIQRSGHDLKQILESMR